MKITLNWLREWVPTDMPVAELADQLTLAGLEVEGIEPVAPPLDGVISARIVAVEKHPDADRLQVCRVDDGSGQDLQIVCGAPNARAGLVAPLARVGTRLPGGLKIRKSKIRGVESFGMLCSGAELGLEGSEGLWELDDACAPGQDVVELLGLDDQVLEIALTPNRGDCLSVTGVARDLGCALDVPVRQPFEDTSIAPQIEDQLTVEIADPADCSAYAGRVVRGVKVAAPTPAWIAERLRRCGLRPINPLVDVTNYVLLELGQPMHAFDLARLRGGVRVRRAQAGETLTLLNDQDIDLSPEELLICDDSGPVALAGAMGGLATAVSDETVDVFLESACFSPAAVAGTGRKFKLSSDSLHRFERGVDPALQTRALERATELLIAMAGGAPGPIVLAGSQAPDRPSVGLRQDRLERILGSAVPAETVQGIFRRLGCQVEAGPAGLSVTPPSWRYDLAIEEDLIEEVARVYGYARLPGRMRRVPQGLRPPPPVSVADRARAALVQRAYHEAASFSFSDPELDARLSEETGRIMLDNPISTALAQMRTTLWSSLLPVWQHNVQRQQPRVRLFELARSYRRGADGGIVEREQIAGIVSGHARPEQWGQGTRDVDFFDLKGDLEALLDECAPACTMDWAPAGHPALHPGLSAELQIDGASVGIAGQLHPMLVRTLDLPSAPWIFELDARALTQPPTAVYAPLAESPSMRRDLALLVPEQRAAGDLIRWVQERQVAALDRVFLFDLYHGEGLPNGFKSVALGLIFQEKSRTLTDEEVDQAVADLASGLEQDFGARLRN